MEPTTTAALIGAGASFLGGQAQNSANREMTGKQQSFQREMASSTYQRGVKDLEAAGLNRVLAAGGSVAPAPSGSALAMNNPVDGAAQAFSNTAQAMMAKKKLSSEIENIQAQTSKTRAEAKITSDAGAKSGVQSKLWKKGADLLNLAERKGNAAIKKGSQTYKNYMNKAVDSERNAASKSKIKPQQINPRFKSNRTW